MHMSTPNELSQRQLSFMAFLLERWSAKLEVLRDPVDEGGDGLPLVADLAGERCPERVAGAPPQARAGIRYLDARKLAKSLKNRSEEHTSELQSQSNLVCRLLLEKKNT